jgi:hypothetical protein
VKQKKEKKLHLGKETIASLVSILDRDDQKRVKGGGFKKTRKGTTQIPIYCSP